MEIIIIILLNIALTALVSIIVYNIRRKSSKEIKYTTILQLKNNKINLISNAKELNHYEDVSIVRREVIIFGKVIESKIELYTYFDDPDNDYIF